VGSRLSGRLPRVATEPEASARCKGSVLRLAVIGVALAIAVGAATAPAGSAGRSRTVPCSESIGDPRFPYVGAREPASRFRLVLGAVSVPPAYLEQTEPTGTAPWSYFRKSGLVVRAALREPLVITVPRAWRRRVAIVWGSGDGVFSSLRISGCQGVSGYGFAYAGGFYLRSRSACVPLVFSVGRRPRPLRTSPGQPRPRVTRPGASHGRKSVANLGQKALGRAVFGSPSGLGAGHVWVPGTATRA
jgi:hypothetical protein